MGIFKRFKFSPVLTVLSLALACTCFYLSTWQFARYEEKKEYFQKLETASPDNLPALDPDTQDWQTLLGQQRRLTGTFDYEREMILVNRSKNKRPGVKLITPMRLAGSDRVVLVDRGFILREEADPDKRTKYHTPQGEISVMGTGYKSREGGLFMFISPPDHILDAPQDGWFRMNITRMASYLPYGKDIAPIYFEQIKGGQEYPISMVTEVLPPFRHLNYTMQWISFGIFIIIMGILVQFRRGAQKLAQKAREQNATAA